MTSASSVSESSSYTSSSSKSGEPPAQWTPYEPRAIPTTFAPVAYQSDAANLAAQLQNASFTVLSNGQPIHTTQPATQPAPQLAPQLAPQPVAQPAAQPGAQPAAQLMTAPQMAPQMASQMAPSALMQSGSTQPTVTYTQTYTQQTTTQTQAPATYSQQTTAYSQPPTYAHPPTYAPASQPLSYTPAMTPLQPPTFDPALARSAAPGSRLHSTAMGPAMSGPGMSGSAMGPGMSGVSSSTPTAQEGHNVLTHASPGSKVTYSLPAGTVLTPTATPQVVSSAAPHTFAPVTRATAEVSEQISAAVQASRLPQIATDASSPLAHDPVHHTMGATTAAQIPSRLHQPMTTGQTAAQTITAQTTGQAMTGQMMTGQMMTGQMADNMGTMSQASSRERRVQERRGRRVSLGGESLAIQTNTMVTRTDDMLAGPKAWVTVPVPDADGGVQFRPRGFSVDGSTTLAASEADSTPWDIRDKYLVAVRSGPTECPDHILAKHKHFSKPNAKNTAGKGASAAFTSPYTVFYFDETAPNNILLDNDVRSPAPVKDPKTGRRVQPKGAIRPKRKPSLADDQSTRYTDSEVSSGDDIRLPSRAKGSLSQQSESLVQIARGETRDSQGRGSQGRGSQGRGSQGRGSQGPQSQGPQSHRQISKSMPGTHRTGGLGTASVSSSVTSTHYVSMQPQDAAGCCGARKRVSLDGGSYYGSSSVCDVKYDRQAVTDYVRVVTLSQERSQDSSSDSSASIEATRFYAAQAAPYGQAGQAPFVPADGVPPTYPPNASYSAESTSSYTSDSHPHRTRACCGVTRRPDVSSSSDVTTNSSDFTSSSASSMSSIEPERRQETRVTSSQAGTSKSRLVSRAVEGRSVNSRTASRVAKSRSERYSTTTSGRTDGRNPACGVCRRQQKTRGAGTTSTSSEGYTSGSVQHTYTSMTGSTGSMSRQPSKVQQPRRVTRHTTESRSSTASSVTTSSVTSMSGPEGPSGKLMPTIHEENMTAYSSDADEAVPTLRPSTKRDCDRDLSYNVRKMFFDVEDLRVPTGDKKGTGLKMLPGYSVSYRNFPVICYDVIAPKDYQDFFRARKTPGMFA